MDTLLKDAYDDLTNKIESELSLQNKHIKYQNTYRLESKNPFNENKALSVIKKEIEKHLNSEIRYDPDEIARISATMSFSIRDGICDMNFERYNY